MFLNSEFLFLIRKGLYKIRLSPFVSRKLDFAWESPFDLAIIVTSLSKLDLKLKFFFQKIYLVEFEYFCNYRVIKDI